LQQGLGEAKGIPQENYSKHGGRREELGIPRAKKGFMFISICILHRRWAEAKNELFP
jgi:hypothetical protein